MEAFVVNLLELMAYPFGGAVTDTNYPIFMIPLMSVVISWIVMMMFRLIRRR